MPRHWAIPTLLKPELDAGLHALTIEPSAPGEAVGW
jgi:BolA family transcriptional regulator, general stress-responsive regulator